MMALAIATSIDALAIGVSFAFLKVNLLIALLSIGLITFIMCVLALKIGNKFGTYLKNKAEFIGGAILIFLVVKFYLNIYLRYLFLSLQEHDLNQKYHLL